VVVEEELEENASCLLCPIHQGLRAEHQARKESGCRSDLLVKSRRRPCTRVSTVRWGARERHRGGSSPALEELGARDPARGNSTP
jgi:hypothetical protein